MAAPPTAFAIWHRDNSGIVDFQYPAEAPIHSVVERCISICRKMLENSEGQRAFVTLAERVEKARRGSPAWYKTGLTDTADMESITQGFFQKVFTRFPTVFVDYTVREPDYLAITPRYPRIGSDTAFEPSRLCIMLNGQVSSKLAELLTEMLEQADTILKRVGHMAGTWARARKSNTTENRMQFNRFLFAFSNTILHELAHLLITYLGQGRFATPEGINQGNIARAPDLAKNEAGRALERMLLGGALNFYRDPNQGTEDRLSGVPYLNKKDDAYQIDQEIIDSIADSQLEFPYRCSGPPEQRALVTMASNYTGQLNAWTDPLGDPGVLQSVSKSVPPLPDINIDELWHPAPRPASSEWEEDSGEEQ
ncbi:MAG: hypothetical protein ALECFALPRED_004740 [Alectoria fallacina]|uniref:Uncharacterized protein n=1 Tax=Alectoria fallacina TaxID=1903189 RepID=A0A8H3FXF6_9LECA|nr:MAG: hypothetical protein ALECFALPRED_004740 [Alectoria fallacina]